MAESPPGVPGRIFISYRREETAYPAGWLFDRLANHFGGGQVFKDVDSIELGDDFVEVITNAVGSCDVLLALIGHEWLTITDEDGNRRLDEPDDFVRLEIEAALARNVRVIPILVEGARMPRADELPTSLAKLVRRQALELSPSHFDFDTNRLLKVLARTLAEVRTGRDEAAYMSAESPAEPKMTEVETPTELSRQSTSEEAAEQGPVEEQEAEAVQPVIETPGGQATDEVSGDLAHPSSKVPWHHRRRMMVGIALVALLLGTIVSGLILVSGNGPPPPDGPELPPTDSAFLVDPATQETGEVIRNAAVEGLIISGFKVHEGIMWVLGRSAVIRVDVESHQRTQIPLEGPAMDLGTGPSGVWIIHGTWLSKFDDSTGRISPIMEVPGGSPSRLVVGTFIWVLGRSPEPTKTQPQTLVRYDPRGEEERVDIPTRGVDVATSLDGIWIADAEGSQVLRIDPLDPSAEPQLFDVDIAPDGIAADERHVWIFDRESGTVTIINSDKVPGQPIPIGHHPIDIRSWRGGALTVNDDGTITYIDESGSVEPIETAVRVVAVAAERGVGADEDTFWAIAQ